MANDDDPTEEMVKREVAAAAKILREDGHALGLKALHDKIDKLLGGTSDESDDSTEGKPPPKSEDPKPSAGEKQKKKGLWWGNYEG